jgi:CheY-like chemotaxis protein
MTSIPFDAFQPRVLFLDDDPVFLETVQAAQLSVNTHVTTDVQRTIQMVSEQAVDFVVSDMKMPGQDGVRVLERVHKANPDIGLALLTGFEPSAAQADLLDSIGAQVYYKHEDLPQMLADIEGRALQSYVGRRDSSAISQEVGTLRQRLSLLEDMHTAWISDLTDQLSAIPNQEAPTIYTESGPLSVKQLIQDIGALNPRGVRYLRLWLRGKRTVREAKR